MPVMNLGTIHIRLPSNASAGATRIPSRDTQSSVPVAAMCQATSLDVSQTNARLVMGSERMQKRRICHQRGAGPLDLFISFGRGDLGCTPNVLQ